jgi:hypothetical protein
MGFASLKYEVADELPELVDVDVATADAPSPELQAVSPDESAMSVTAKSERSIRFLRDPS